MSEPPGPANANTAARALDLFEEALDQPEGAREAWLRERHGGDPELLAEVTRLLTRDAAAAGLLPTALPEGEARGELSEPPDQIGAYSVEEMIGQGGMGAVYLARRSDGLFEHTAAVKLLRTGRLDSREAELFATERRTLARLNHPNIARLLDGGVTPGGAPYILMDYVEGAHITDFAAARRLAPRETAGLLLQVCEATAYAHRSLVAHGDLKPANVLVTPEGQVRLVDFGVSRMLDLTADETATSPLTSAYASPERRGGQPPTAADDIYALATMARELLEGRGPTVGEDAPARRLDADLRAVLDKATAGDPQNRYGSVELLADDLARWRDRRPVAARGASPTYVARRFAARRPALVAASFAAITALAATAVISTSLYFRAEREHREAERRFADARRMATYMLFPLMDQLNNTPGTIAVRRELVDTSRRYLEDLSGSRHAPAAVKVEAALGYLRLAGVLGLSSSGQLGEREQAREMMRRAERLLGEAPPDSAAERAQWLHAQGRLGLQQGFDAAFQGGDAKLAQARLREGAQRLEESWRLAAKADVLADLWETRINLADLQAAAGDHKGAEAAARAELAQVPSRARALRGHDKAALLLGRTYATIGNARYYQGDLEGAVANYRRQTAAVEGENRRRPGRSRTLTELIEARWNLATTLDELGRRAEALTLLDAAIADGRGTMLVDSDNDILRRALLRTELDRLGVLARMGRARESAREAELILSDRRSAAAAKPNDPLPTKSLLAALRPIGDIDIAAGRRGSACTRYREALAGWTAFGRRFPIDKLTADNEIAGLRQKVAACGPAS